MKMLKIHFAAGVAFVIITILEISCIFVAWFNPYLIAKSFALVELIFIT